jgi:GNAT superfamily N-acetyltransferase
VRVESIADHLELVPVIARWHWNEWGHTDRGGSLESWTAGLGERTNRDRVPTMFVAFLGDVPVGSSVLVEHDMDTRLDLSPWLAGIYVLPEHRRKGVASALVERAMAEASRFGVGRLYLYTRSAVALYETLGWRAFGSEHYEGRDVVLMSVELPANGPAEDAAPR